MAQGVEKEIAITVDVEGEWYGFPGEQSDFKVEALARNLENLENSLNAIEDTLSIKIPITWFIRCDDAIAGQYGENTWLIGYLSDFIDRRSSKGDLFGIHPHLYSLRGDSWATTVEAGSQCDQIERAVIGWVKILGCIPKCSRIGEALMNDQIAELISEMGIKIDSTALPGRKRFDNGFQFDWEPTLNTPYYPSKADYRVTSSHLDGENLRFLEVPFTMLPMKSLTDNIFIRRYLNLAYKPNIVFEGLQMQEVHNQQKIISVLHPHEIGICNKKHPLISYDLNSIGENISNLTKTYGSLKFILLDQV